MSVVSEVEVTVDELRDVHNGILPGDVYMWGKSPVESLPAVRYGTVLYTHPDEKGYFTIWSEMKPELPFQPPQLEGYDGSLTDNYGIYADAEQLWDNETTVEPYLDPDDELVTPVLYVALARDKTAIQTGVQDVPTVGMGRSRDGWGGAIEDALGFVDEHNVPMEKVPESADGFSLMLAWEMMGSDVLEYGYELDAQGMPAWVSEALLPGVEMTA